MSVSSVGKCHFCCIARREIRITHHTILITNHSHEYTCQEEIMDVQQYAPDARWVMTWGPVVL